MNASYGATRPTADVDHAGDRTRRTPRGSRGTISSARVKGSMAQSTATNTSERTTNGDDRTQHHAHRSAPRLRLQHVTVVERGPLKRAIAGAAVGNLMEWYDIGVYGYLAVLIGQLFLPSAGRGAQTLFSMGVLAVTFVARPIGGIVLGQLGDRLGRQRILAFTLTMMALATTLIGLLPTYSTIGAWAPVLLILLKLAQGFSTGGEYAGATTFVTEYAPDRRRGKYSSYLDFASFQGFAIGAALVSVLGLWLSDRAMATWGWRIPFLLALPLGGIAIYFRLRIEDSPAYQEAQRSTGPEGNGSVETKGVLEILRSFWRPLLIAFTLAAAANTVNYAVTSYMPTYLTSTLGYDSLHGTLLTLPVLILLGFGVLGFGALSDRVGRRRVLFLGAGGAVVLAVPAFLLMGMGHAWSTMLGIFLLAIPVMTYIGNLAASLPALFPTSSRYGAMGISYNLAVALLAGTAPFIMQSLVTLTHNPLAPAFWIMFTSTCGFIAVLCMPESARRPMPGALPAVASEEEARQLVEGQDDNPDLDVEEVLGEAGVLDESQPNRDFGDDSGHDHCHVGR